MPTLFDDTYKGPRYRYGLRYRPMGNGTAPQDYIIFSNRKTPEFPNFGTFDYPRKLTEHEVEAYQLVEVKVE